MLVGLLGVLITIQFCFSLLLEERATLAHCYFLKLTTIMMMMMMTIMIMMMMMMITTMMAMMMMKMMMMNGCAVISVSIAYILADLSAAVEDCVTNCNFSSVSLRVDFSGKVDRKVENLQGILFLYAHCHCVPLHL